MTRKKKSRKPGAAPSSALPKDKSLNLKANDKKPKKKTGKSAGNRQQEAIAKKKTSPAAKANKDPRVGSKKPIELGSVTNKTTKPKVNSQSKSAQLPKVRVVDTAPTLAMQIAAIENDERLLDIIAKQEQDLPLSEQDVEYYNDLMEQHEQLSAQLPAEQEEDLSEEVADDDALWDKLDNNDFSEFE